MRDSSLTHALEPMREDDRGTIPARGGDRMTRRSATVWPRSVCGVVGSMCGVVWLPAVIAATMLSAAPPPPIERFIEASSTDERRAKAALEDLAAAWKHSYTAMIVDMARMMRPRRRVVEAPAEPVLTFDDERSVTGTDRRAAGITEAQEAQDRGSPVRR